MGGARSKSSKGVVDYRPYVTRSIPVGAQIVCADNTGAKIIEIVNVHKYKTRVYGAVIIRQKYAINRLNGVRVQFEDNAGVLITPEGEVKGTDIKGPVAAEATEKWPRVANLASMVV